MMRQEPPNRTEIMLQALVEEQRNTNTLLTGIRHKVEYTSLLLLVAFLLHFIGCPMLELGRESQYQPPPYQATLPRTSPR